MAWWDELFNSPLLPGYSTTVPIPQNLPGPMAPPNIPFKYGLRDQRTGDLHSSIFGTPYIPTQFDAPNTFNPGAVPGQMDVAPKPPLPPMMGRAPAPAAMPMPGALPEGQNPPGAMGMGDLSFPGAMTPAGNPSSPSEAKPTRKPFDWSENASLWPILMQAGQGLMQPSYYGLGGQLQQGLAGASDAAQKAPMQKAQRRLLEAQVGEAEQKTEQRKATLAFADTIKDPTARSYMKLGLTAKALERLEKIDPEERQRVIDFEVAKQNALLPGRIAVAQAGKPDIKVDIPKAETSVGKLVNDIGRLREALAREPQNKTLQQALRTAEANLRSEGVTQDMRMAAYFGTRADAAHRAAEVLEASKEFDPAGSRAAVERGMRDVPIVGDILGGPLMRQKTEEYDLQKREFIAAVLRKESGAQINPSEFRDGNIRYFAQPGDSTETVKKKAVLRKRTVEELLRSSGGAYEQPNEPPPPPAGFNRVR